MPEVNEKLSLVWGAEEIAKLIGRSKRATFYMLDSGELPAKKVGGRWVAERNRLINFFLEAAE
ncbi:MULTISPECIES: MerR family transcriptional regulator [unclassified Rhizobium]|uniref:DNA-binding protein n=1 Tax=unclassified Rhizobium TaxID=2613769 RepID=UPI001ADD5119|nr:MULTISPECIES: DNA-binding protein [unclassified Rhizobium]MBO9122785.1 DNA-binding protein [Rhizobium sp. 16-488-2b]MBO9173317.1 DNA-binding protein [Rhizobium sp. 16-488-2a]